MSTVARALAALGMLSMTVNVARGDRIPISTCHQAITGGAAELVADLDCSATPLAIGVDVNRSKLYLNGHSITGAVYGVACLKSCTIIGPGTISGNETGVALIQDGKVVVRDVTITANDVFGVAGDRVRVYGSTVDTNGGLLDGAPTGAGIVGNDVKVRTSNVTGNLQYGLCGSKLRLGRSTVQGNGTGLGCTINTSTSCAPGAPCGDVVSPARPRVDRQTVCDASVNPAGGTWSVCADDAP
jgi:hypothetical protein